MKFVWAVFKREVKSYFVSPLAYAAIAVFLAIQSVLFAFSLGRYQSVVVRARMDPRTQPPALEGLIRDNLGMDILWALFLIVPLLTMRLLAEERRQHTAELLLTAPMKTRHLVLGKYLGSIFVLVLMLGLTIWMPLLLRMWADVDPMVVVSGYAGAFLYAAFLLACGLLASSLTESSIMAAFLALLFVALATTAGSLAAAVPYVGASLGQFTPTTNLGEFAKGVIDTRAVVYFATTIAFVLDITARIVDSQRWR